MAIVAKLGAELVLIAKPKSKPAVVESQWNGKLFHLPKLMEISSRELSIRLLER